MYFWNLTALLTRCFFNPFYLSCNSTKKANKIFSSKWTRDVISRKCRSVITLNPITIAGGVRSHCSLSVPIPLTLSGVFQKRWCEICKWFNDLLVAQVSTKFKVQNVKLIDWITERELRTLLRNRVSSRVKNLREGK